MDDFPEEAIPGTQPGTATGSGQHGQLVPQQEILDNQVTTISESGAHEAQQQTCYFKHIFRTGVWLLGQDFCRKGASCDDEEDGELLSSDVAEGPPELSAVG